MSTFNPRQPDGTPGWHRRYQQRQAEARHAEARLAWWFEVQYLAELVGTEAEGVTP